MNEDLIFSVCIPTFNMGHLIGATISNVLAQSYGNYEVVVSDNCSQDNTKEVVESFKDVRIKYFRNETNVDYFGNLRLCFERAQGDIFYLMSGKTRISKDALALAHQAFKMDDNIGAVTRPYYWHGEDINIPVRAKERYAKEKDLVVSIDSDIKDIIAVFHTLDNPGGLAFRREYMDVEFQKYSFVEFIYPFASILKKHKVVLLKDYVMCCPAFKYSGSQNPVAYENSPLQNWINLFNNVFFEDEFKTIRQKCIKEFVCVNYIGLVQIRNYARKYSFLLREIYLLIKYRWQNLFNLKFWFFSIGTMVMPRRILIPFVAQYKARVNHIILKSRDKKICLDI